MKNKILKHNKYIFFNLLQPFPPSEVCNLQRNFYPYGGYSMQFYHPPRIFIYTNPVRDA